MVKANDEKSMSLQQGGSAFSTHIFEETQFMGVTAYQNQQVLYCDKPDYLYLCSQFPHSEDYSAQD